MRYTTTALAASQEASEAYLIGLLEQICVPSMPGGLPSCQKICNSPGEFEGNMRGSSE
eukprot:CCRYP_016821-RB/>CCRYP_016821-RB protein AED:0.38 eAED:0.30 QI:0/-1/0/1/-1/0/1/0/57